MATTELPRILDCSVTECSFNHSDGCSAAAITMGAKPKAACQTFIPLSVKGGLDRVTAFVGACTKEDCVHNTHLECTAEAVRVGADQADCLTYEAR